MMLSPQSYKEMYLIDKNEEELLTHIKGLKMKIGHLKNIVENPGYRPSRSPSERVQIKCMKQYLTQAISTLEDIEGNYQYSKTELKSIEFNQNIRFISKIIFEIGGFFEGHKRKVFTIKGNKIELEETGTHIIDQKGNYEIELDEFFKQLSKIDIGEWRRNYKPERFGYLIMDGTQWTLEIHFSNETKAIKIYGDNAYPYNFNELLDLLGEPNDYLEPEYTISIEAKNDLLDCMIKKIKELPLGSEVCTSQLLQMISTKTEWTMHLYIYDGLALTFSDMMSLDYELKMIAEAEGVILDNTIHDGEVLGFPFHTGFVIEDYEK